MGSLIRRTKKLKKWVESCPRLSKTSRVQWTLRLSVWPRRVVSTHCFNLAVVFSQWSRLEQEYLLGRLKPVDAGYHLERCCMEGTRQSILNRITAWVTNPPEQSGASWRNTYWFYGSPGIGKTSLAHSICASLHDRKHLAGAYFCQRDDPQLSEPSNILPTLTHKLAEIFPTFRRIVVDRLR